MTYRSRKLFNLVNDCKDYECRMAFSLHLYASQTSLMRFSIGLHEPDMVVIGK